MLPGYGVWAFEEQGWRGGDNINSCSHDIGLYGKLARIVGVYDALTSRRCCADKMNTFVVLKEMKECIINCFDTELFQEFINFPGQISSGIIKECGGVVCLSTWSIVII